MLQFVDRDGKPQKGEVVTAEVDRKVQRLG